MYQKQARYEKAEAQLLTSVRPLLGEPASTRARSAELIERLAALYDAWGKPDKAAEWRKKLSATSK